MRAAPVIVSIALHGAMVFGAMKITPPAKDRVVTTVEFDIQTPTPITPPEPSPSPEPAPEPSAPPDRRLAMQPNERVALPRPRRPEEEELEPSKVQADPNARPEVGAQATAKIDLNLKSLPGANTVILPAGSGAQNTTTGAPRKEWKAPSAGDPILGKLAEQKEERFPLKALGGGHYAYSGPGFSAHIHPTGEVSFDDKYISGFNGTSGSFDVTDMIMRGKKQDPYRYEKQRFLESTMELRAKMQARLRHEAVRGSLAELSAYLERVWSMDKPAREKRRILLQLWDETSGGEDRELEKAGAEARTIILSFVRRRLPAGGPVAFTEDEISSHNRGGKPRFEPYATASD